MKKKKIIRAAWLFSLICLCLSPAVFAETAVNTGTNGLNPWVIVILVVAVAAVILALLPRFRKK